MNFLNITPEVLYSKLVYLLVLVLLLFAFIFLGIKAFAIGGAFGAVINSLLPMVGAGSVGSQDDRSDDSSKENIKKAVEKSLTMLHHDTEWGFVFKSILMIIFFNKLNEYEIALINHIPFINIIAFEYS